MMKPGEKRFCSSLSVLAAILGSMCVPQSLHAYLAHFNFLSLNASYDGSILTIVGQASTTGDVDRGEPVMGTASFTGPGYFSMTMNITLLGMSASGSGTLTLTDINGDKITANVSGNWTNIFGGLANFDGALSNAQFVCSNNCVFEGNTGSFPMTFATPLPYGGPIGLFVPGRFDAPFSGKNSQADGFILPQTTILAWRSVRTHGGSSPLSIALNATATGNGATGPTVEPRSGGVQKIAIDFDRPVSLGANPALGISVKGRQTTYPGGVATLGSEVDYGPSQVSLSGSNTLVIDFNPGTLPDDSFYTIELKNSGTSGVLNEFIAGDRDCNLRSLYGDSTGNGLVNLSDALLIKARTGTPAASAPQLDVNLSNVIDLADVLAAKARVTFPAHRALAP